MLITSDRCTTAATDDIREKLNQNNWWLKNAAASKVQWIKGYEAWDINFTDGMVLVNPKGNGTISVTIESGYRKLNGTQDTALITVNLLYKYYIEFAKRNHSLQGLRICN